MMEQGEEQQRSLRIPISSSSDFVEIFPDEIPSDVNSLLDVLRAEYAPLKIWRAAALEYYRQGQLENFSEVLNEIVSAMDPEIEEYYRQRGEYEEGIVEIFDALAGFSLYQSYSFVEDPAHASEISEKLETLKGEIVGNIKKAEGVNRMNEYTWMIRGFYELSYGDLGHAEYYLRNVYDRACKQKQQKPTFFYGSTLGLGAVAYAGKKYTVALDYFVKAIQCNPLKCGNNVRIALATCCFKLEQYDRARLAVDRVLSIDPCNVDALLILSLLQRIDSGKVGAKRRQEYHRVARDLCNLVTQLSPTSALGLNQMANYKFDDWKHLDVEAAVISATVLEVTHGNLSKDYSAVEAVQFEDMIRLKRGLVSHVVSQVSTRVAPSGKKVTTIVVKADSEVLPDWVGKSVVITSTIPKSCLNEVCRIAAKALVGTNITEVRAESYYILGRVYHLLGQYDNAMKFYDDALDLLPEMSLAAFGLGQLHLAKEEFDLSYAKFQEVQKRYPDDRDTQAYLLFIQSYHKKEVASMDKLKEVAPGFAFEADLWLSQGHAMHQKGPGEYRKSLLCYEMALSVMQEQGLDPHHHVLLNMGVLYHATGNLKRALHYTRLALSASDRAAQDNDTGPTPPNPTFLQAENDVFYEWSAQPVLSLRLLPASTVSVPVAGARKGGVTSLFSVEEGDMSKVQEGTYLQVDGAVVVVEDVSVDNKEITCRGLVPMHSSSSTTPFPALKKIPLHNFNNETVAHCFNLGRIHEDMGRTQAAREVYLQLLQLHPSFLECYLRLSMIASEMGQKKEALKWIERGTTLDKDNVDATVVFGDLYCQMEDWENAKKKFLKVCKERHKDARAYLSMGNVHFALLSSRGSLLKESMKFYHPILRDDQRNIYAANGLGMVLSMEGKSDSSRDVFSRVSQFSDTARGRALLMASLYCCVFYLSFFE